MPDPEEDQAGPKVPVQTGRFRPISDRYPHLAMDYCAFLRINSNNCHFSLILRNLSAPVLTAFLWFFPLVALTIRNNGAIIGDVNKA